MIITPSAFNRLKLISSNKNSDIRLEIISGGCHGYKHNWKFDKAINNNDDIYISIDDFKLIIDSYSYNLLENAIIDYVDSITESKFSITFSTFTKSCGCGVSFSL